MLKGAAVLGRDTHQYDATTRACKIHGLFDGGAAPRRFDCHVHFRANGQWLRAQLHRKVETPRERIADKDFGCAGKSDGLDEKQAKRASAKDGYAVAQPDLGKVGRVERNAERLKHGGRFVIKSVRHRKAGSSRHDHEFAQASVVGIQAAEMKASTEVRMSALAEVATMARMSGVDGHARAGTQAFHAASEGLDYAGEFVPENERGLENGITDAGIGEGMKIAAANTGGGDAQQDVAGTGIPRVRNAFNLNIARAVQPCRQYGTQG
jgi:hypothetical protein